MGNFVHPRFECKNCGMIVSNLSCHLEKYHDDLVDIMIVRGLPDDPKERMKFYLEWFEPTKETLSSMKKNYYSSVDYIDIITRKSINGLNRANKP